MQQRRLRLGDILDDYCPRERRITNHAVVAMIEDQVKQTRCTTCDADHEYKQARVPVRRKKDGGALVSEAGAAGPRPRAVAALPVEIDDAMHDETTTADVTLVGHHGSIGGRGFGGPPRSGYGFGGSGYYGGYYGYGYPYYGYSGYGYPYYGYGYPYRRRGWGGIGIRIW